MSTPLNVKFFRKVGEALVEFQLVIDPITRVEISFGPIISKLAPDYDFINSVGAKVRRLPDGGLEVVGLTDYGHVAMDFFNLEEEFKGSDAVLALRARYKDELKALEDAPECSDCAVSALMRRYGDILKDLL